MLDEIFSFFKTKTKTKPVSPAFRAFRNKGYEDTSIEVEKPEPYVWLKCPPQKKVFEFFAGKRESSSTPGSSAHALNLGRRNNGYRQKANTLPCTTKRLVVGCAAGRPIS